MAEARVENIESIVAFKRALWRFAEIANAALTDAEADAVGTLRWLETEQRTYWQMNLRKSQELVGRCAEALRHKKLFKDSSGRTPSAVDEEKALAKAKRQLEYAEQRLENVRRYAPRLQREILLYKGQAQRLSTFVAADIPTAAAKLDKIVATLQAYLNLNAAPASGGMMNLPAEQSAPSESPPPATETPEDSTKPSEPT